MREPDPPLGSYSYRVPSVVGRALLTLALYGIFAAILWIYFAPDWGGWLGPTLAALISSAAAPVPLSGLSLLGRLRGGAPLRVTDEGLHVQEGGAWTVVPFLSVPEPRFIPWDDVEAIEVLPRSGGRAVIVAGRGLDTPGWLRWARRRYAPGHGIVLGLPPLDADAGELGRALAAWGEELGVRRIRQGSRALDEPRQPDAMP